MKCGFWYMPNSLFHQSCMKDWYLRSANGWTLRCTWPVPRTVSLPSPLHLPCTSSGSVSRGSGSREGKSNSDKDGAAAGGSLLLQEDVTSIFVPADVYPVAKKPNGFWQQKNAKTHIRTTFAKTHIRNYICQNSLCWHMFLLCYYRAFPLLELEVRSRHLQLHLGTFYPLLPVPTHPPILMELGEQVVKEVCPDEVCAIWMKGEQTSWWIFQTEATCDGH